MIFITNIKKIINIFDKYEWALIVVYLILISSFGFLINFIGGYLLDINFFKFKLSNYIALLCFTFLYISTSLLVIKAEAKHREIISNLENEHSNKVDQLNKKICELNEGIYELKQDLNNSYKI